MASHDTERKSQGASAGGVGRNTNTAAWAAKQPSAAPTRASGTGRPHRRKCCTAKPKLWQGDAPPPQQATRKIVAGTRDLQQRWLTFSTPSGGPPERRAAGAAASTSPPPSCPRATEPQARGRSCTRCTAAAACCPPASPAGAEIR